MGIVQKDALRVTIISYLGLILGYLNKAVLMIIFLSVEEIGLVNLLISVGLLFGQASNLGSVYATWKFLPFFSDSLSQSRAFLWMMMKTVGLGCLLFALLFFLFQDQISSYYSAKSPDFVKYSMWILPIGFSYGFYLVFETYLRSFFLNILPAILFEFVLRLLTAIIIVGFGFEWYSFNWFIALHSLVFAIPTVYLVFFLYYKGWLRWPKDSIKIKKSFRRIVINFSALSYFNTLGTTAVITIDAIMLSAMMGLKETGVYTTVVYLTSALMVPYRSILRISSPLVAINWKQRDMVAMRKLYTQVSSVCLFIGLVLFTLIWINRIEVFSLLPKEYETGVWIFLILMMGKMTDMYFGINGAILNSSKSYKVDLIFTAVLLSVVVGLNLILIKTHGVYGAAISTALGIFLFNILRLGYVWKKYGIHPFENSQLKLIAIFCLFLGLMYLLPQPTKFSLLWVIAKCVLLFVLTLVPIYIFNLEKNTVVYMKKVLVKLKLKSSLD